MISKAQIQGLKDAKKLAGERGHDLHPFPPFYSKLVNGTQTACRKCGRKAIIEIRNEGPSGFIVTVTGLATLENCAPGSVKV